MAICSTPQSRSQRLRKHLIRMRSWRRLNCENHGYRVIGLLIRLGGKPKQQRGGIGTNYDTGQRSTAGMTRWVNLDTYSARTHPVDIPGCSSRSAAGSSANKPDPKIIDTTLERCLMS